METEKYKKEKANLYPKIFGDRQKAENLRGVARLHHYQPQIKVLTPTVVSPLSGHTERETERESRHIILQWQLSFPDSSLLSKVNLGIKY